MFSQSSKSSDPRERASSLAPKRATGEPSIISADLRVVGDLHCSGDLQVRGDVDGDIKSNSVTIGEGAHVTGSVVADMVRISGSIKGQIEAATVSIDKSGRVVGDIVHETLAVEAGAYLEGNCRRLDRKKVTEIAGIGTLNPNKADSAGSEKKTAGAA